MSSGSIARIDPSSMPLVGRVAEQFQSYNVEMVEVTGGRFWKPYAQIADGSADASGTDTAGDGGIPAGMDPGLYEYRPPIDLSNPRLRSLAAALAPAYVRVSGTWANTVYLPADGEDASTSPPGFSSVLRRDEWAGVVAFADAVGAGIVTSMSVGTGSRDDDGAWAPVQAQRLLDLTADLGGVIVGAEFFNEPTMASMGGAPDGYDAAAFARDHRLFCRFVHDQAPDWLVLGPGSVGESASGGLGLTYGSAGVLPTEDLLTALGEGNSQVELDRFTFHHYGAASARCAGAGMPGTSAEEAVTEEWLSRVDDTLAFYVGMRDRFCGETAMWCTETAQAACGGDEWAGTFLDTFRYVDQLGRFALGGVEVQFHNTLAASDYGLLDETTFAPRPNYWAALLWRKLMGTAVLDARTLCRPGLFVYAHAFGSSSEEEGVTVVVVNVGLEESRSLFSVVGGDRYTLSAPELMGTEVYLNDRPLRVDGNTVLIPAGEPFGAGAVEFAPATITFLTLSDVSRH